MGINKRKGENDRSLKFQLLLNFFTVGIIPLIVFAVITSMVVKVSMYSSQVSSLKQISSMAAKNIDKWGDDNILLAEEIANSQSVVQGDLEGIQAELKNKKAKDSNILNIMYADLDGNIIKDSNGSINESIKNEVYFSNVSKGYTYTSDVFFDSKQGIPVIVFSAPVKEDNVIKGYIINSVKVDGVGENIGKIIFSDEGKVFTFDSKGNVTYHEDEEKIMKENLLNESAKVKEGAEKALRGNFSSIEYKHDGIREVAVYNYVSSLNWGVITTIPRSEVYAAYNRILLITLGVITLISIVVVLQAVYVSKKIVDPISTLAGISKNVAEGDLRNECELHGSKEINDIGKDFNEMIKSLKELVLSIQSNSTELMNASTVLNDMSSTAETTSKDIAKAMEEISSGSVEQAERSEFVLSQVRNLDDKMKELETELNETNNALEVSKKALNKGNDETVELKNNTEVQNKLVSQTVTEVKELSDAVVNIDQIIVSISEIADQTSLLSLNASIEAARAGEAGKGFAVVAEEVAALATQSQESTKQISLILNDIRNKANKTTELMAMLDNGMKLQSSAVEETLKVFKEVTNSDSKIAENIESFNTLIEFIKKFSDELLTLIETLASSSEESAAVAEEVTASSSDQIHAVEKVKDAGDNISGIVNKLNNNIEKFKTE